MPTDPAVPSAPRMSTIDRVGALWSGACAVHCAAAALLPGVAAALGAGLVAGETLEWGLTLAAILFACAAFASGWRKHRALPVAAAFIVGASGLLASRLLEDAGIEGVGTLVGIAGALALVTGHALNYLNARRAHGAACE